MTAIILLPVDNGGYEFAKIYRASSATGEYTHIDTINSVQLEYEDSDGDYSNYYQITWYDGTAESIKIPVQSSIQKIINIIRVECKISTTALPDSEIHFLTDEARRLIQLDICKYYYGVQIYKLADGVYELPGHFYYDHNCGGAISMLDIGLFKQTTPITIYSEKTDVYPTDVDFNDYWVKVPPLEPNEILKVNYYTVGRRLDPILLNQLIAYKISAIYFENLASNSITTTLSNPYSKVKIGPISVENGTSTSVGTSIKAIIDFANKMNAKYNKLVTNFKKGFYRVN